MAETIVGIRRIKLTANFDEETFDDAFPYGLDPFNDQHQWARANDLELQIGINQPTGRMGEDTNEKLSTPYMPGPMVSFTGGYLELEWRTHRSGSSMLAAFSGRHSWLGAIFPRLMANFHVTRPYPARG
jgi:hypothetical protein